MTKPLPQNFPPIAPDAIATYDYTDIADGTGVKIFYGCTSSSIGTADYYLTGQTPFSNQIVISGGTLAGAAAWAEKLNTDFDVQFNKEQDLKGTAYLTLTLGVHGAGTGDGLPLVQVSGATLIHYDGTTETILATASSDIYTAAANDALEGKTMNMKFETTGVQHFKSGDTLRLSIPLWASTTGTAGLLSYGYGADPQDRNDTDSSQTIPDANTTKLELHVPFRIDL